MMTWEEAKAEGLATITRITPEFVGTFNMTPELVFAIGYAYAVCHYQALNGESIT